MADWIDDDWDSSSPIGSPSSLLPQSIREVLESVRAECSAGNFAAYCIDNPSTEIATNAPHKDLHVSPDENTIEIAATKEIWEEGHGHIQVSLDKSQNFLPVGMCKNLALRDTKDSALELIGCETNNSNPQKVTTMTEDHQINNPPPSVQPDNTTSLRSSILKTQVEGQFDQKKNCDVKRKLFVEPDVTQKKNILSGGSVANEIAPNKHPHQIKSGVQITLSVDLTDSPGSPEVDDLSMKRKNVVRSPQGENRETIDLTGDDGQVKKRVHKNTEYIDLSVDSQPSERNLEAEDNQAGAQEKLAGLEEGYANDIDETLEDHWVMNDGLNEDRCTTNVEAEKHWSSHDSSMDKSPKSSPFHGFPEDPEENDQQSGFKPSTFHHSKSHHDDANLEWAHKSAENSLDDINTDDIDSGKHQINKVLQREQSAKNETLHKELEEKYMSFLQEVSPMRREYHEHTPVCEEIEEFARACDESPMQEVKIEKQVYNYDEAQSINRKEIYRHNRRESLSIKEELGKKTMENSLTVWRNELLSSDFNLIYGSLRAFLMRNISKDDRRRLIQTMLATMSEIEEVTMGEGCPRQNSVRCETPEPTSEFHESEEEGNEPGLSGKEAIQSPLVLPDYGDESIILKQKVSELREKEAVLNIKRINKLMRMCSDGTLACLVCQREDLPEGRPCRACSAMTYRIQRNYTLGIPLPTCNHANYSGGAGCKSCRFRKFSFLSMTATDTRVRKVKAKECPICKRITYRARGWKCQKCHFFLLRLKQRQGPMPNCKHNGKFPATCDGCRCYNIQEEWVKHEYGRKYPFPLIKSTKNSDSVRTHTSNSKDRHAH